MRNEKCDLESSKGCELWTFGKVLVDMDAVAGKEVLLPGIWAVEISSWTHLAEPVDLSPTNPGMIPEPPFALLRRNISA